MKFKILFLGLIFLLALIAGTSAVEAYYMMGYGMMGYPSYGGYHMGNYGGYYNPYYGGYGGYNTGYYGGYGSYGYSPYGNIVRPVGLFRARYYSPFLIGRAFDNLEYDRISDFGLATQVNTFRFINSQNNIRPNQIYY